jgi:hypothetical protein
VQISGAGSDGTVDMQMMFDAGQALGGPELVLLKHKRYEHQQEYRILWELDTIGGASIDVVAPNARQFCRKVDAADYGVESPTCSSGRKAEELGLLDHERRT